MDLTPNQIYKDPEKRGGTAITNADVMNIFCDFQAKAWVNQSTFFLPKRITGVSQKIYMLSVKEAVNVNQTHVLVKGFKRDLSKVYVFNKKTGKFVCVADEFIQPYGDQASMDAEGNDKSRKIIMGHSQRVKAFKAYAKMESEKLNKEIETLEEAQGDFENLIEIL